MKSPADVITKKQLEVWLCRHFERLDRPRTEKEIAKMLGIKRSAVHDRLARLKKAAPALFDKKTPFFLTCQYNPNLDFHIKEVI